MLKLISESKKLAINNAKSLKNNPTNTLSKYYNEIQKLNGFRLEFKSLIDAIANTELNNSIINKIIDEFNIENLSVTEQLAQITLTLDNLYKEIDNVKMQLVKRNALDKKELESKSIRQSVISNSNNGENLLAKEHLNKLQEVKSKLYDLNDNIDRKIQLVSDNSNRNKLIEDLKFIQDVNKSTEGSIEIKNVDAKEETIQDLGLRSTINEAKKAKLFTSTNMTSIVSDGKIVINPDNYVVSFTNTLNKIDSKNKQYGLEYIKLDASVIYKENSNEYTDEYKAISEVLENPIYKNEGKEFKPVMLNGKHLRNIDYEREQLRKATTESPYEPGIIGVMIVEKENSKGEKIIHWVLNKVVDGKTEIKEIDASDRLTNPGDFNKRLDVAKKEGFKITYTNVSKTSSERIGYNTIGAEGLLNSNLPIKFHFDNSIKELFYLTYTSSIYAKNNYYTKLVANNDISSYSKVKGITTGDFLNSSSLLDENGNEIKVFSGIYNEGIGYVNPITVYAIAETTNFLQKDNESMDAIKKKIQELILSIGASNKSVAPSDNKSNSFTELINGLDRVTKSFLITHLGIHLDTKISEETMNHYLNGNVNNVISNLILRRLNSLNSSLVNDKTTISNTITYLQQVINAYTLLSKTKQLAAEKVKSTRNNILTKLNNKKQVYSSLSVSNNQQPKQFVQTNKGKVYKYRKMSDTVSKDVEIKINTTEKKTSNLQITDKNKGLIAVKAFSPRLTLNQQLSTLFVLAKLNGGKKLSAEFEVDGSTGTKIKDLNIVNVKDKQGNVTQGLISNLL